MSRLSTAELQRLDAAHYLHPFTDSRQLAAKGARVITQAEGVWLTDSDGHRILDGMAGLWCVALGYGRELAGRLPADARTAVLQQLLPVAHPPRSSSRSTHRNHAAAVPARVFHGIRQRERHDGAPRAPLLAAAREPGRNVIVSLERLRQYGHGASLGGMKPMHEREGCRFRHRA